MKTVAKKNLPISSDAFAQTYNQALKYLNARMHTVGELSDKLQRKRFSRSVTLAVLRRLLDLDFLNDERYAQIFVENLKRYKDFGYYGMKVKLQRRRIPTDIVVGVLEEFLSPEDELAIARRFLGKLKKMRRVRYEQIARSLSSKGFRGDVIVEVLRDQFSREV